MTRVYNLSSLRALALFAQELHIPNLQPKPDADAIHNRVDKLGCVQIDTLQMVQRSHYLVLWSRLGSYEPGNFYSLVYGPDRRLFEGWQHAASIIPLFVTSQKNVAVGSYVCCAHLRAYHLPRIIKKLPNLLISPRGSL